MSAQEFPMAGSGGLSDFVDAASTADFMAGQIIGAPGQPVLVGPVVYRGPEDARQWYLTTATYTADGFFAADIDFDDLESADEARLALLAALRAQSVEVFDLRQELEMAQPAAILWPCEHTEKPVAELIAARYGDIGATSITRRGHTPGAGLITSNAKGKTSEWFPDSDVGRVGQ